MKELNYYKPSEKINLKYLILVFLCAMLLSYWVGLLYHYLNNIFYSFITEEVLKDLEIHSNQLGAIIAKVLVAPKGFLVVLLILFILFVPLILTFLLLGYIMIWLRKFGKSRNQSIDFILFVILSFICFFVSNEYKISTTGDYLKLFLFFLLALFLSLGTIHYFCEKCSITYKKTKFYLMSELNSDVFIEKGIEKRIEKGRRYKEKEVLDEDDIENIYYVELYKCKTCGSKIVTIESKIIEVDSDGKKKIKDGKKITEDLLLN
jgi:hypothetical protein